ncbi:MAG: ester cyclase [Anaerolineae bacterium]|jgi:predicted ester cyclase
MSVEGNKTIVRRYLDEAGNKGNLGIIDELMAPDYARYTTGPVGALNRESQKQRIAGFRAAFPDIHVTIEDIVSEADKVTVQVV